MSKETLKIRKNDTHLTISSSTDGGYIYNLLAINPDGRISLFGGVNGNRCNFKVENGRIVVSD